MQFNELTRTEQILLGSVVLGSVFLTSIVILCIIWKRCWIYKYLWQDEDKVKQNSKRKSGTDDIICIRYPPDIYPHAIGVYRENVLRSPEDELAGLFQTSTSPIKRDSTYSSMSEGSNGCGGRTSSSTYELAATPPIAGIVSVTGIGGGGTNNLSPTGGGSGGGISPTSSSSIDSPDSTTHSISPLLVPGNIDLHHHHHQQHHPHGGAGSRQSESKQQQHQHQPALYLQQGHGGLVITNISPVPPPLPSLLTHPKHCNNQQNNNSPGLANMSQQFNEHQLHMIHNHNHRQPFFTFALKFEEENGMLHIDFIEARNLPLREYLNLPCDVFFTIEIQPKRHVMNAAASATSSALSLASALSSRSFGRTFTSACKHYHSHHQQMGDTTSSKSDGKALLVPPHYRFVTKTLKKVLQVCDFSETYLAQLSKTNMKDYFIRFTAFDSDRFGNPTELGSTTLTFDDFHDFTSHKLILSCSLKEPIIKLGEILVGLCHLPTAERVSLTIAKITNLNPYLSHGLITKQSICYVRVLLVRADTGKVLKRKKTTYQRCSGNSSQDQHPQFNETLVFDMPPAELTHSVFLVLVCITNKVALGGSAGTSPTGTMNLLPGGSHSPFKRHSTPDANFYPSSNSSLSAEKHQQLLKPRHSVCEALFHYGDNLTNKQPADSRSNSIDSNASSYSDKIHSSNLSINEQSQPTTSSSSSSSSTKDSKDRVVGKIALGYNIRNVKGKCHWEQMVRSPRNVTTEWHTLR